MTGGSSLVALVLAGGAGSRMGTTGAQIPKVYLPVGLEPVINRPVSRALQIENIKNVYILTRKRHPSLPNVDLEQWETNWQNLWYPKEKRIEPIFEEDLEKAQESLPVAEQGAVVALARAAYWLAQRPSPPSHVLILAGDNFIDHNVGPLLQASSNAEDDVIIATRSIANRAAARGRFGVVEVNYKGDTSSQVIGYEEKPDEPKSSEVSIGLYVFPLKHLQRINNFLTDVSQLPQEKQKELAGAPGYFLEWLVRTKVLVRAVRFDEGIWVDVGTPSSLLSSIVQLSSELIERPQCARDLDVLGSTKNLNDRYYFVCKRVKVERKTDENVISLFFQGDDPIAALGAADGKNVIPLRKLRDNNRNANSKFWSLLEKDEEGEFSATDGWEQLDSPILISGGVFLIDRASAGTYQRGTALLPLFMRDFGAPVDAGRLTTAAGRMDKLDLLDVCVSEHSEEMVFIGTSAAAETTRILICAPPEWRSLVRETILDRLLKMRLLVPGIDPKRIELEKKTGIGLTVEVETMPLVPPKKSNWKVKIYYRDSEGEEWKRPRHEYDNFVLIPDRKAATLEFRVLWLSALTSEVTISTGSAVPYNKERASFGRLLGIVDGDGHARTALMVKVQDFVDYIDTIKELPIGDILFSSDQDDGPALSILAATDGRTGRLSSFERRLPVASCTTSVYWFAEILKNTLRTAGGT